MSRNFLAKRLAREQGISYTEALRQVQAGTAGQPSVQRRLLAEVKRECWELVGEKVAYRFAGGVVAGVHFADDLRLPAPPRIEQMRVHVMDTDCATMTWQPVEVGSGVQTGSVTVDSRVGFRCEMKVADPIEDPTLGFPDEYVDEDHVLVSLEREVLLRWHAVLVDGQDPDLVFDQGQPRTASAGARSTI